MQSGWIRLEVSEEERDSVDAWFAALVEQLDQRGGPEGSPYQVGVEAINMHVLGQLIYKVRRELRELRTCLVCGEVDGVCKPYVRLSRVNMADFC